MIGRQENESHPIIKDLVRRYLLASQIPASQWSVNEEALVSLSKSILQSSIKPPIIDFEGVISAIKKQIVKVNSGNISSSTANKLNKFDSSTNRLQRTLGSAGPMRMSESGLVNVLYFLLRVSERASSSFLTGSVQTCNGMADLMSFSRKHATAKPPNPPHPSPMQIDQPHNNNHSPPTSSHHSTQAQYWQQYKSITKKHETSASSSTSILRQLIFVLRALDAPNIRWHSTRHKYCVVNASGETANESFVFRSSELSDSDRKCIERICECATAYKSIVESLMRGKVAGGGHINQAFGNAIKAELREYLEMVAYFESLVYKNSGGATNSNANVNGDANSNTESANSTNAHSNSTMTLCRALVYFDDGCLNKLLFFKHICEPHSANTPTSLINSIATYTDHGNPAIAGVCKRILALILKPLMAMIAKWLDCGVINDVYGEFFIASNSPTSPSPSYSLVSERVPNRVISSDMAEMIFETGKLVSFNAELVGALEGDGDGQRAENDCSGDVFGDCRDEEEDDDAHLVASKIKQKYKNACLHTRTLLHTHFHVLEHFRCIANYLHFGRGDFGSALMEGLAVPLSRPASALFRHALVATLDTALATTSNTSNNAFVSSNTFTDCIDVRIHESGNSRLLGWDVFTLDYRVPFPLAHPHSPLIKQTHLHEHIHCSHFLWSLKRVHTVLTTVQKRVLGMQKVAKEGGAVGEGVQKDLKRLGLGVHEGHCLASQLASFALLWVRSAWQTFFASTRPSPINERNVDCADNNKISKNNISTDKSSGGDIIDGDKSNPLHAILRAHDTLIATIKSLSIHGCPSIREHLARLLGDLLKFEGISRQYERLLSTHHDQPTASITSTLILDTRQHLNTLLHSMTTNLDAFLMALQKQSYSSDNHANNTSKLIMELLDMNAYHKTRNGFDHQKYAT